MKACEQKKCLYYEPEMENNCNDEKIFEKCDAKHYNKKVITQMDMNEIIDKIKNEFNRHKALVIGCRKIKRELEQYFEEI